MKPVFAVAALLLACSPALADTAPEVGKPAPSFTAADANGASVSLDQFKGKIVVLEWSNKDCPFVHKHYDSGNMQSLQRQAMAEGVEWLTVISSAPGNQGFVEGAEARQVAADRHAVPGDILLDPSGSLGHLYAAKTTPDMFVIDRNGILAYEGAIDDKPSADKGDIAGAHNYVRAALDAVEQGKPVADPVTVSYGCAVHY